MNPIIIGGVGGSGTRIFVEVLEAAGVYMGRAEHTDWNEWNNQPMHLTKKVYKWASNSVYQNKRVDEEEYAEAIRQYLPNFIPSGFRWGYKAPQTMYLIKSLINLHKDIRYIHVVRDGRDMAYSSRAMQAKYFSDAFLGTNIRKKKVLQLTPEEIMRYWAFINQYAANLLQAIIPKHHVILRFEDMLDESDATIDDLYHFLDLEHTEDTINKAKKNFIFPKTLGRWRGKGKEDILEDIGFEALEKYGYI